LKAPRGSDEVHVGVFRNCDNEDKPVKKVGFQNDPKEKPYSPSAYQVNKSSHSPPLQGKYEHPKTSMYNIIVHAQKRFKLTGFSSKRAKKHLFFIFFILHFIKIHIFRGLPEPAKFLPMGENVLHLGVSSGHACESPIQVVSYSYCDHNTT
jgi:hypothetical protein